MGAPCSELRVASPFDVTAENREQWLMGSHATPRARSIEANLQLQRRIKSLVGPRQSSEPPTLNLYTRATQWGREIHVRLTRLASGISFESDSEGDARRREAPANERNKTRKKHKWLSEAAVGIPPPSLQMQT